MRNLKIVPVCKTGISFVGSFNLNFLPLILINLPSYIIMWLTKMVEIICHIVLYDHDLAVQFDEYNYVGFINSFFLCKLIVYVTLIW